MVMVGSKIQQHYWNFLEELVLKRKVMRSKLSYLSRRVPQQLSIGRWTQDEKLLFLLGLKRYGKGRWKKMSVYLPHRYV
jgi:hypothetical protein